MALGKDRKRSVSVVKEKRCGGRKRRTGNGAAGKNRVKSYAGNKSAPKIPDDEKSRNDDAELIALVIRKHIGVGPSFAGAATRRCKVLPANAS